jgi:hypothetical protein
LRIFRYHKTTKSILNGETNETAAVTAYPNSDLTGQVWASKILIPMDDSQKNHLKAYGIAYWVLKTHDTEIDWLLNYRGGSFLMPQSQTFINEMVIRGVSYEVISDAQSAQILSKSQLPMPTWML